MKLILSLILSFYLTVCSAQSFTLKRAPANLIGPLCHQFFLQDKRYHEQALKISPHNGESLNFKVLANKSLIQINAQNRQSFSHYIQDLDRYLKELNQKNPDYLFKLKRDHEDVLTLYIKKMEQPFFAVRIDSRGSVYEFFSPSLSQKVPQSLEQILKKFKIELPQKNLQRMDTIYSLREVYNTNKSITAKINPEKTVNETKVIIYKTQETLRNRADQFSTATNDFADKIVKKLQNKLDDYIKLPTEKARRELLVIIDEALLIRTPTLQQKEYGKILNTEKFRKAFNKKVQEYDHIVYTHGQPSSAIRSTIQSGEISGPALRGLKESTDCGSANICVGVMNSNHIQKSSVSLDYNLSFIDTTPPGAIYLVKPSSLDNFSGQPATRSVLFSRGNSDGRLLKILVPLELLAQTRKWLRANALDPDIAIDFLSFVKMKT